MLAIVYALVVALVVLVGLSFVPFLGFLGALLPALVVAVAAYLLILRRVNALLQKEMAGLQGLLMNRNVDGALSLLAAIKARFSKWIPLVGSQIDGQIGSILYMKKDFEKARPYLQSAFVRMWDAKLMLACLLSGEVGPGKSRGDMKAVDALLDKVVRYTPKQGLLYSTWAWLHWKAGDSKRAVEVLARGKEALGDSDPNLTQNLLALQNDKKMKMKGYGEVWYSFHLEQHPMVLQQQRGGHVRFARR